MGGRLVYLPFERDSKLDWLFADIDATLFFWAAGIVAFFVIGVLMHVATGIDVFGAIIGARHFLARYTDADWVWRLMVTMSLLLPGIPVFIARWNPFASPRRELRYLCRWL